jgi:carbon monoxide dehydrogenase subunit G
MRGEVVLPADKSVVWEKLNDAEMLKLSIPGCQTLEKTSETSFAATAKIKIGPMSTTFRGNVNLCDLDPPNGYRIEGEGQGGVAGYAKGAATVRLAEDPAGTRLSYDVEAQIGGKLAQLGARLIDGVAKKIADEFFAKFADAVKPGA